MPSRAGKASLQAHRSSWCTGCEQLVDWLFFATQRHCTMKCKSGLCLFSFLRLVVVGAMEHFQTFLLLWGEGGEALAPELPNHPSRLASPGTLLPSFCFCFFLYYYFLPGHLHSFVNILWWPFGSSYVSYLLSVLCWTSPFWKPKLILLSNA